MILSSLFVVVSAQSCTNLGDDFLLYRCKFVSRFNVVDQFHCTSAQLRYMDNPSPLFANASSACRDALLSEHCTERAEAFKCAMSCYPCVNGTSVKCTSYLDDIIASCPLTYASCYQETYAQSFLDFYSNGTACPEPLFVGKRNSEYDPPTPYPPYTFPPSFFNTSSSSSPPPPSAPPLFTTTSLAFLLRLIFT